MKWLTVFIILLGTLFLANLAYQKTQFGAIQCLGAYPNAQLTPGKADTSDFGALTAIYNGQTYSQSHRNVPQGVKNQVMAEYGVQSAGEIDHFISLGLGGSNSKENLWPEPTSVICNGMDYGFRTKDRVETYLISQMKSGKISPIDAQNCLKNDWIACYQKYLGKSFGATPTNEPPIE